MARPTCPNCGKSLAKYTTVQYAPRISATRPVPRLGWDYTGNQKVTARRYILVDPIKHDFVSENEDDPARKARAERRLHSVHVWDGETYSRSFNFFCSNVCAGRYARRAVHAGWRPRPSGEG